VKSPSTGEQIAVQYPEVVLSVEVYHNSRKWAKVYLISFWKQSMLFSIGWF